MRGWNRNGLLVSSAIVCMAAATPAAAQTKSFDVPAQSVQSAVNQLGRQADIQIIAARSVTRGTRSKPVRGNMTVQQALSMMLEGTGLIFRQTGPQTYTVVALPGSTEASAAGQTAFSRRDASPAAGESAAADNDESAEIVVTGTNIRGTKNVAAPLIQVRRADIERAGYGTLERLFESLPQNFSEISPDASYAVEGGSALAQANSTATAGIDLRGLGAQSTLTLLNGTRRAGSNQGQIIDISAIPISLIDRVEVVTGGQSAIYGADAVAGVVNIITRRKFDGAETQVFYGTPTEFGGGDRLQASQTFGKVFEGGSIIAAYDYAHDSYLNLVDTGLVDSPLPSGIETRQLSIQPKIDRHTLYLSGSIDLSSDVEVHGEGIYTRKEKKALDITLRPGAATESFTSSNNVSDQYSLALGVTAGLTSDWQVRVDAVTSTVKDNNPVESFFDFGPFQFTTATRLRTDASLSSATVVANGPLKVSSWLTPRVALESV